MSPQYLIDTRPNVFLTAFLRSGSTHVKETLLRLLPGYRPATTSYSAGAIGNDGYCKVDIQAAQMLLPMPCQVFHQHTPGTSGNVELLKHFKIKPVIQMRNMLDSIVSFRELLAAGQQQNVGIYYPDWFQGMPDLQQLWWCTKVLPTWYFTFYLSWKYADIDKHIIWYDEYFKDQVAGLKGILDHVGLSQLGSAPDDALKMVTEVIDRDVSRLNVGRPGRGREILTPAMLDDIKGQAMAWPEGNELIEQLMVRGYD